MMPEHSGPPVLYSVTATLPDEQTLADYLSWLRSGHLAAVMRAGASSARAVRILEPPEPLCVATIYDFPSRSVFRSYQELHAPRLRAEGAVLFGPRAVAFERRLGAIEIDTSA